MRRCGALSKDNLVLPGSVALEHLAFLSRDVSLEEGCPNGFLQKLCLNPRFVFKRASGMSLSSTQNNRFRWRTSSKQENRLALASSPANVSAEVSREKAAICMPWVRSHFPQSKRLP